MVNLLHMRPVRALMLWKAFPCIFQAATLLALLLLAFASWGHYTPAGVAPKLYAKSNLVTLIVWGLWWPAMIWITVLFGRIWCMICPLELAGSLSERAGRWLGIRQRALRPWLIAGPVVVALYGLLQFLVAGAQIHRIPGYTSIFLCSLLLLALVAGLIYKDRAICRGFCPVGELLATYGRGGMLAVRPGCDGVRSRCPSLLNLRKLKESRDCLLCGQCFKPCGPDDMQFLLRSPFHSSDARPPLASWPTTIFVMLVSGFVSWELCTEWKAAEDAFLSVPRWTSKQLGLSAASGYVNGLWALLIVPLALWTLLGSVARLPVKKWTLTESWRRLALPLAVIVAAGQMAKGLAKFVSWAGFLRRAGGDPAGTATVISIARKTLPQPAALLPMPWVSAIGLAVVLAGFFFAVREGRIAQGAANRALVIPQMLVATTFLFIIFGWGFLT